MIAGIINRTFDFCLLFGDYILTVRHSSHQGGSPWNGLGDEQTCGMTLALAYVLCHLSTV